MSSKRQIFHRQIGDGFHIPKLRGRNQETTQLFTRIVSILWYGIALNVIQSICPSIQFRHLSHSIPDWCHSDPNKMFLVIHLFGDNSKLEWIKMSLLLFQIIIRIAIFIFMGKLMLVDFLKILTKNILILEIGHLVYAKYFYLIHLDPLI